MFQKHLLLVGSVLALAAGASAQNVVLSEDFSAGVVPPSGWTELNNGNDLGWEPDGFGYAGHIDFSGWNDNHLMTPVMDFSGLSNMAMHGSNDQVYASWRYENSVEVSLDGGLTFAVVYTESNPNSGTFPLDVDLVAYDGMAGVNLSFHYLGDYANAWFIDHMQVDDSGMGGGGGPPPGSVFFEDFSSGTFPPAGWTELNNGNDLGWEESYEDAWHDDYSGWNDNTLMTSVIDLSATAAPALHFRNTQTFATWRYENTVEATMDGGLTWTNLYTDANAASGTFETDVDLAGYGSTFGMQLGFHYTGDYANEWFVDNVNVDDGGTGGGGPNYVVTNLVAGQVADFTVSGCDPASSVIFAYSLTGSGPVSTPFGDVDMSNPIKQVATVGCDSAGVAALAMNIPSGAAGLMVYTQCAELLGGGVGNLTNSHAIAVQ